MVAPTKSDENLLKLRYEELIKMNVFSLEQVTYREFDFHARCHENSDPYKNFVKEEIYPNHLEKSGIYCKSFKLVTEIINGQSSQITYKNVESRQ